LGQLYYYDSTRVNLGLFQRDVNVLWDLAVASSLRPDAGAWPQRHLRARHRQCGVAPHPGLIPLAAGDDRP